MKYGFLIPVYNHGRPAYSEVLSLLTYKLPIILIDDASNQENKEWLAKTKQLSDLVTLVTLEKNLGKGGAVYNGFIKAHEIGLTHVLQLDADGQHDINRIPKFLEISKSNPKCAVVGYPEFDSSAPKSRSQGRGVANFFVHFVTMNKKTIKDSMCGFRVYPVEETYKLLSHGHWDYRMGFDIEILVRLYWKKVNMISESVKVIYPDNGSSNFHMIKDNARISLVFTKLCFKMIFHIPINIKMRTLNK